MISYFRLISDVNLWSDICLKLSTYCSIKERHCCQIICFTPMIKSSVFLYAFGFYVLKGLYLTFGNITLVNINLPCPTFLFFPLPQHLHPFCPLPNGTLEFEYALQVSHIAGIYGWQIVDWISIGTFDWSFTSNRLDQIPLLLLKCHHQINCFSKASSQSIIMV